ncbi:unnamed protein product [Trifolium pratense]|uniref:Uncharacterized protein n=1 Tax=Trifolium pratense TaxID=57577 RepID=A0ACB0L6W6_TRIPR|nr:unnamed protein product [Trifolium pratense]
MRKNDAPVLHPYLSLHREESLLSIQNPNLFYFRGTRPNMHHLDAKMIFCFCALSIKKQDVDHLDVKTCYFFQIAKKVLKIQKELASSCENVPLSVLAETGRN